MSEKEREEETKEEAQFVCLLLLTAVYACQCTEFTYNLFLLN